MLTLVYVCICVFDYLCPRRLQDGNAVGSHRSRGATNGDQTVMTARQLLSILRLGQVRGGRWGESGGGCQAPLVVLVMLMP